MICLDLRTQHELDFGRGDDGPICRRCGQTIFMDMLARDHEVCPATLERYAQMLDQALGIIKGDQ